MVNGFGLSDDQAYDLLAREYNPVCVPPWDLTDKKDYRDFRRKIDEARKTPPRDKPQGWLLEDDEYSPKITLPDTGDVAKLVAEARQRESANPVASQEELDYLCMPTGLLGRICSWINATAIREQPLLSLGCTLAALGTLFGRKVRDEMGTRTNIYCLGVARSSGGKAHAMNQIRNLFAAAGASDLIGGDTICSDSSIEERLANCPATLFLWDEIGHLLSFMRAGVSANHQNVITMLMKLYSAAGSIYKGREYAIADKQRTIIQPCLSIYGASTPERLASGLSPENLQDGWLGRTLPFYAHGTPTKRRRVDRENIPDDLIDEVNRWFAREIGKPDGTGDAEAYATKHYKQAPPQQIIVPAMRDAEQAFIDFDAWAEQMANEPDQIESLWLKAEENARRIALIVAAGESFDHPAITKPIANYACRLIAHIIADFMVTISPEITHSYDEAAKRKLVAAIRSTGKRGCVKGDLTRKSQFLRKSVRDSMLADLLEAGEIFGEAESKTARFWTAEHYTPPNDA